MQVCVRRLFAGTSFEREGADSSKSVEPITLPSGTIQEGADNGSSGAKRRYVPFSAFPSNSPQISGGADAERLKISNLDWGSNDAYDDGIDWAAIASDPLRQWS